jgi:hypothetical protein
LETRRKLNTCSVIDAAGHVIERNRYLKAPFNKRGGPLTASEPWDRHLQQTCLTTEPSFRPRRIGTRSVRKI